MGVLSVDQIKVFITIVEHGSFGKAARFLRRHQSAVSYAVAALEQQLGIALFHRSEHKIKLTPAGEALLADARRVTYSIGVLRERAQRFSRGTEAEIVMALDAYCPLAPLEPALKAFTVEFPMVKLSVNVQQSDGAVALVLNKQCTLGVVSHFHSLHPDLHQLPLNFRMPIDPYVAAAHPLAKAGKMLESDDLAAYTQILPMAEVPFDHVKFSGGAWRTNDLLTTRSLLRAGIGWAFMPHAMVEEEVTHSRLVMLNLAMWPRGGTENLQVMGVYHSDTTLGPAATWLLKRMSKLRIAAAQPLPSDLDAGK